MTEEDNDYKKELEKRQLYNYSAYDKAILTLSSASFAFSLLIVKDFGSQYLYIVFISWICFVVAIIGSLFSFYIANKAIEFELEYLGENEVNKWTKPSKQINNALGIIFSIGIIFILIFSYLTLTE